MFFRLSSGVAKHLTSRLDDGEILLTNTEGRIHQEDEGYVDLELAKQQLDSQKVKIQRRAVYYRVGWVGSLTLSLPSSSWTLKRLKDV